jgi:hypothetical protein
MKPQHKFLLDTLDTTVFLVLIWAIITQLLNIV